jgi:hypothetical protein
VLRLGLRPKNRRGKWLNRIPFNKFIFAYCYLYTVSNVYLRLSPLVTEKKRKEERE